MCSYMRMSLDETLVKDEQKRGELTLCGQDLCVIASDDDERDIAPVVVGTHREGKDA